MTTTHLHREVNILMDEITLEGELIIPTQAVSIVIFSHGSGSSRVSKRNQAVARYLHENNFGTLLFDLLTREEDLNYNNRFNIDLLTKRMVAATQWLENYAIEKKYHIGYFGASTGAASALKAAAVLSQISAIVSRGSRPDLAMKVLSKVKAPTLLIVGGLDKEVLQLNQEVYKQLVCEKKLSIVEGATHLFEETGKMKIVAELACNWFKKYMKT